MNINEIGKTARELSERISKQFNQYGNQFKQIRDTEDNNIIRETRQMAQRNTIKANKSGTNKKNKRPIWLSKIKNFVNPSPVSEDKRVLITFEWQIGLMINVFKLTSYAYYKYGFNILIPFIDITIYFRKKCL